MKRRNKNVKANKNEGEFYFDDCPVCQEMKKEPESGESLTLGETKELFKKVREKNKDDLYYDAMECLGEGKRGAKLAEKMLLDALKFDEHYVQTYIGLAGVYRVSGARNKEKKAIIKAYEETLKKFKKWPKRLEWGFLENRAYLRALQSRADLFWDDKNNDEAVKLFKLLLKLNRDDNQGVRYEISALYAGISGIELDKLFAEGNANQDWDNLQKLVEEQNSKHTFWKKPKYE